MTDAKTILKISGLKKQYSKKEVLKGIDIEIKAGEFVVVIGPSGAGKSTFIRCINRMVDPTQGAVEFDGIDVAKLKGKALREARSNIGMIFQHYNLIGRTNVIKNVLHGRLGHHSFFKTLTGRYSDQERREAFDLLQKVGLGEHIYKKANALSGGQMQRVGICRAMMQDPKLLLADEPIASLDPKSAKIIMDQIKDLVIERHIACVMNLHQVQVAKDYATRIIGIKDGCVVYDGVPNGLTEEMMSVKALYLEVAFDTVKKIYGTFDTYLKEALKVTDEEISKLRTLYLV
ncbi:MAG: phosphonate ABC transporter ATP-binding protein [Defluviitaleaceae bacterium]|nr:phosphonate ABC transporter ATP-binding protein [Defluviitaleaceae bacterium]